MRDVSKVTNEWKLNKHIEGQRNWEKRGTEQVNVKVSMKSENEHWNGRERVLMDGPPKTKILRDREKYKWELAEKVFQGCLFARKRWKLGLGDAGMHQVLLFTSTSLGHRPNFCTISLPTYSSDPILPPFLFHLHHFLPLCTFCSHSVPFFPNQHLFLKPSRTKWGKWGDGWVKCPAPTWPTNPTT